MLNKACAVPDLTLCDREPIHIPGAIQPHGLLLVANLVKLTVEAGAGDIEGRLAPAWLGQSLETLLGQSLEPSFIPEGDGESIVLESVIGLRETFDVTMLRSDDKLLVELETAESPGNGPLGRLALLERTSQRFERAATLNDLCREAAAVFRDITGYDRVMIYRFLEDDAGVVIAESHAEGVGSFMNHHFPASDIPRQARELYVRNRIRVIPAVDYTPAPLRPGAAGFSELDLSDASLRSVSPIHLQYLRNMDVAASASVSIVQDGYLWGLIACHNRTPRQLSLPVRISCRTLAGSLSRQIRAKDEAVLYRERIRLRSGEDMVCQKLGSDTELSDFFQRVGPDLQTMLRADGFAAMQGGELYKSGHCPDDGAIRELGTFVKTAVPRALLSTDRLEEKVPSASRYRAEASGLLAVTMSTEVPTILLWFRAEKLEVVKWAGNPHRDAAANPEAVLTPRTSFEDWAETVQGRSRPWSLAEIESAGRLVQRMLEDRGNKRLRLLNDELSVTIRENEGLIRQKDFLLKEVNHRVQNSLQLVMTFLRMQSKEAAGNEAVSHLAEAQRRISAVALVHRRLYSDTSVEVIDLGRYLEDLATELLATLEHGWREHLHLDLAPVLVSADRAVTIGLLLTELIINANKYAYGGQAGPLSISLEQHHNRFRLIVSDHGAGKGDKVLGTGFGSRMLAALVSQLDGTIDYSDNFPGVRSVISAPVDKFR